MVWRYRGRHTYNYTDIQSAFRGDDYVSYCWTTGTVELAMTMWIDREVAVQRLGDSRLDLLLQCHDDAWVEYNATIRPRLPLCDMAAMATILHEIIKEKSRELFLGVDGVLVRDPAPGGRFLLEVDRKVVVQFKKLTKDFRTVNNPTVTSLAFDRQQLSGELDVPPFPRLTAGYKLGQYGTEIEGIWLAFVIGDECIWYHDLRTGEYSRMLDLPVPRGPSPAEIEREEHRWRSLNERKREDRA